MKKRFALTLAGLLLGITVATASAASLSPLYSATAGSVKQVSIAYLQQTWVVTAVENSKGNLQVMAWNDSGSALVKTGSAAGGAINKIAVTGLDSSRVVTADVNPATGNMEISVWKVSFPGGSVAQQGSTISICCTATSVSIARIDATHVATAATLVGTLFVNVFKVSSTGTITTDGVASAGAVSQTAIVGLTSTQVVTATRNASNKLEVIAWGVGGGIVTQQGSATTSGTIKHLAITSIFTNQATTAMVNSGGNLELINWGISTTGTVTRQVSATAGAASQIALCQQPILPFTAIVDGSGDLAVEAWTSGTKTLKESATYDSTSAVTLVAVAPDFDSDIGMEGFVTAARGSDSNLELEVWLLN